MVILIWRFVLRERNLDIFALFVKYLDSKTRECPYSSEPAQSYYIDKILKHFGDVLEAGHKGTDPKDFFPALSTFLSLKAKRNSETNENI